MVVHLVGTVRPHSSMMQIPSTTGGQTGSAYSDVHGGVGAEGYGGGRSFDVRMTSLA